MKITYAGIAIGIFIIIVALLQRTVYATDAITNDMPVSPPPPTPVRCETPLPEPTPSPTPFSEPEPDIVCTVVDYTTIHYAETSLDNVREFIDAMPECEWCCGCGLYSRYTYLEAEKKGLEIGELTLIDPDQKQVEAMVMSGHRMNYFIENGKTYYIENTKMHRMILNRNEICDYILETYGIDIETVGFKDVKKPIIPR